MEESERQKTKFLGSEKVGKLLRMFAIPCVLSLVIQALYNIVDQIFIGNSELGAIGNTATGIVYPLTVVALALGLLIGDGSSACISINQGKNQTGNTHKTIGTGIVIGTLVSLIMVGLCFAFRSGILTVLGGNGQTLDYAIDYSTFIILGFPFFIVASVLNPIIRADGSPKFAMFSMMLGAVTNIILDPILIYGAKMGMTGAALATFIAQAVTFLLSVGYLFKAKNFRLKATSFVPDFKLLLVSMKLGVSSFLNQIAIVIISIVNNNLLVHYLSEDPSAIGVLTIAFKVFGIIISVAVGVSAGGQPIVGYNYGAKKYDRVKQAYKLIMIVTLVVGAVSSILFVAFPKIFLYIFGYKDEAITVFAINTFRIYLSLIVLTCFTKSTSIFFQSIGMPVKSTLVALLRDIIFLVPLAIFCMVFGGVQAFMWSAPISDILTTIVAVALTINVYKGLSGVGENANTEILPSKKGIIITLSREHGSGGREIAMQLANALKVPFYDKNLASIVAQECGLNDDYIDKFENGGLMYSLLANTETQVIAMSAQDKVLKRIADNGSCVILGRASDYVLKDYDICKIHVYAPQKYKVDRVMKNYGDSEKLAKANIVKSENQRANYYKFISGKNWNDSANYDLCIDGSIGVKECVDVILKLVTVKNKTIKTSKK